MNCLPKKKRGIASPQLYWSCVRKVKENKNKTIHFALFILSHMSKAFALSSSSPEYKGIAGLNIIYEAGRVLCSFVVL